MRVGRLVASASAAVAVAGCAFVVVGMGRADQGTHPATDGAPTAVAVIPAFATTGAAGSPTSAVDDGSAPPVTATSGASGPHPAGTTTGTAPSVRSASPTHPATTPVAAAHPTYSAPHASGPQPVTGSNLPVGGSTSGASRVITVVASSAASTTATLQAWNRAPGGGWLRYGPAILAHVGSDGLTSSPSEFRSATPIGSFSLTQAFGRDPSPGGLPYFQTTPADWWISQSGPYYNTHQRCSGSCPFDTSASGSNPNEHLYYETPYYNYAVVINTPSGASAYPHGSAFFLHVTDGYPTAGCVAIPQSNLVTIMRWLVPSAHPRILIGVS